MKLLQVSIFFLFMFALAACSDDDESVNNCMLSDWVGTYTGIKNCFGVKEDVILSITANGPDAIIVRYESASVETVYDPLTPDGCKIDITNAGGSLTYSVDASLDGDNLIFTNIVTGGGADFNCTITATRD